eukprot:CAMPEP_0114518834 /NCGR_PEP_ID=MMETSP0109-20121206/18656_1 /TAXON_ID=29199 /ORGANISM="Chlorarachnion reptans, Strain CCCM449" /LENGTH=1782 /DNA_ID=CAMNT_0001699483 /DNA_START=309 /DNA_END=5657 /DNA_ORIENTATION=+
MPDFCGEGGLASPPCLVGPVASVLGLAVAGAALGLALRRRPEKGKREQHLAETSGGEKNMNENVEKQSGWQDAVEEELKAPFNVGIGVGIGRGHGIQALTGGSDKSDKEERERAEANKPNEGSATTTFAAGTTTTTTALWCLSGSLPLFFLLLTSAGKQANRASKSGGGSGGGEDLSGTSPVEIADALVHLLAWLISLLTLRWHMAETRAGSRAFSGLSALFLAVFLASGAYRVVWDAGRFTQGPSASSGPSRTARLITDAIRLGACLACAVWRLVGGSGCDCVGDSEDGLEYARIEDGEDANRQGSEPVRLDEDGSNWVSWVMLWWINPLFRAATRRPLEPEDLPQLAERDQIGTNLAAFKRHWEALKMEYPSMSTRSLYGWALWRTTRGEYLVAVGMTFVMCLSSLSRPLILQILIAHLSSEQDNSDGSSPDSKTFGSGLGIGGARESFALAGLLFIAGIIEWTLDVHSWKLKQRVGMRARGLTITLLYEKILRMSTAAKSALTDGKIVNTMSTDTNRIEWVFYWTDFIVTATVYLFGIIILLYVMFGWSAFVGAGVTAVGMPLMTFLGHRQAANTKEKMKFTDERLDLTRQMLLNMRVVKFYTWEAYFRERIEKARAQELIRIRNIQYLDAMQTMIGQSLPTLMALTCFAVYTGVQGGELGAADAIAALGLFGMLKDPFFIIPHSIRTLMEAKVSLGRIGEVLDADEVGDNVQELEEGKGGAKSAHATVSSAATPTPTTSIITTNTTNTTTTTTTLAPGEIRIDGANFYFAKEAVCPAMAGVRLHIPPGTLTMCIGAFGSGKSFLLSALLGEVFHSLPGEGRGDGKESRPPPHGPRRACARFCGLRGGSEEAKEAVEGAKAKASPIRRRIAYVPQTAWVLNATVRDNILFGSEYDETRYRETLVACALVKDLEALRAGDMTEIGERGVTLSGGQKQRLGLARAVYKRGECDVFLFDDPLSALDAHVTEWVFRRVFLGLLKGKTVVVVTHQLQYAACADRILVMRSNTRDGVASTGEENEEGEEKEISLSQPATLAPGAEDEIDEEKGLLREGMAKEDAPSGNDKKEAKADSIVTIEIAEDGAYAELLQDTSGELYRLLKRSEKAEAGDNKEDGAGPRRSPQISGNRSTDVKLISHLVLPELSRVSSTNSTKSDPSALAPPLELKRQTSTEVREVLDALLEEAKGKGHAQLGELIDEEERAKGTVRLTVYLDYISKGGYASWALILSFTILILLCYRAGDIWVTRWASDPDADRHQAHFLTVYAGITVATLLVAFVSTMGMAHLSYLTSRRVHGDLLRNLQTAPMAFFDTTPTGRVTNRFSRDIDSVDEEIAGNIYWFMRTTFQSFSMVVVIAVTIIYFSLALVPVAMLYWYLMQFFRGASRDVKRIDSTTKSPIFNHFSASLEGLPSIRAFAEGKRFMRELVAKTEKNMQAFYMSTAIGPWLTMQLAYIGAVVQLGITLACLTLKLEPAIAGLCISYGFSFSLWLQGTIKSFTALERSMNSIERTTEYTNVASEGRKWKVKASPEAKWPSEGGIVFRKCNMRYRPELPKVLKELSVEIKPTWKVGICGRTGAGKSSLVALLMRLCEADEQNSIMIDGMDISEISLPALRSKVGVIPQDPVVFPATVKANLDPYGHYSDEEIMQTVQMVHLKEWVEKMGGLEYEISSGSEEMSLGQKQLLCMARALLSRPKILILDEATASIDYHTDQLIQQMVTREFKPVTVLTIAHRIDTIIDYDRILVLDKGKVAEFGPPNKLIKRGGIFASLVKESKKAASGTKSS